ncbi:MAG: CBS domain-containing protein, partial [Rhodopirellula sp.]|nr:CBS domain-containing protein [Rhodopirellula sp.]
RDAANVLAHSNFHSLPVVDGKKLVGLVTSTDLIRYLVDQY